MKRCHLSLLGCLLVGMLVTAAPVPKASKSPVEIVLSGNRQILVVTLKNTTKEELVIPYKGEPLDDFEIELVGDNGKRFTTPRDSDELQDAKPGKLTIPPMKSVNLQAHICHAMPLLHNPKEVTIHVRWKFQGSEIKATPVTFK